MAPGHALAISLATAATLLANSLATTAISLATSAMAAIANYTSATANCTSATEAAAITAANATARPVPTVRLLRPRGPPIPQVLLLQEKRRKDQLRANHRLIHPQSQNGGHVVPDQ